MELPKVRYYLDGRIHSDWVDIEYGEAVITARLQLLEDGRIGWADKSGLELTHLPLPSDGEKTNQSREEDRQGDERVQSREAKKRQAGTRKRTSRKKPQAGDSNRAE